MIIDTILSAMIMEDRRNWLEGPCTFHLSRSYANKCCACEQDFRFLSRGYTCEFCGYYCHKAKGCSRKMWLSRELLRRRICSKCDRYRNVSKELRQGGEFTYYQKCGSTDVTLVLDESAGSLLILQRDTGEKMNSIGLDKLEGVRRGFSLGGRLRTSTYDPLRSLSLTVKKTKRELTDINLIVTSAWACQMWVDGLLAAKYVHKRMLDQHLANEWYDTNGHTPYNASSRLLHSYLPKNSELKRFRRERRQTKTGSVSPTSNDSGVDSSGSSMENLVFDDIESYIDIEVSPDSSVISREINLAALFKQLESETYNSVSLSTPTTPTTSRKPSDYTSSPSPLHLPVSVSDVDIACRSTPGLPYATRTLRHPSGSTSSLCSCHAYQIVKTERVRSTSAEERRRKRLKPQSAGHSPSLNPASKCCYRCTGHCRAILDINNL